MRFVLFYFLIFSLLGGQYLDSKSCSECHQDIYNEHSKSMHHNSSIFKDMFHKAIVEKASPNKYDCAFCHSPAANNLATLKTGEDKPNLRNVNETDGVSCFYCHQITKVFQTKHQNINFYNYKGGKPTFFANLSDADFSDKHESQTNQIYKNSTVCMGCHSHKFNSFDVEICNIKSEPNEPTSDCIGCHMPKTNGSPVNVNKRGRNNYASHSFFGIRDENFVKQAVDLKIQQEKDGFSILIKNKMGHQLILQPMRMKYVKITIKRNGKIIWQNFTNSPLEDKRATFTVAFKNSENVEVLPPQAKNILFKNNLAINEARVISYDFDLQKSDEVTASWHSMIVRPQLAKELGLGTEYLKVFDGVVKKLIAK